MLYSTKQRSSPRESPMRLRINQQQLQLTNKKLQPRSSICSRKNKCNQSVQQSKSRTSTYSQASILKVYPRCRRSSPARSAIFVIIITFIIHLQSYLISPPFLRGCRRDNRGRIRKGHLTRLQSLRIRRLIVIML